MDPTLFLLGGLLGGGKGQTQSTSNATNSVSLAFNPTVVASTGSGATVPSIGGSATLTDPTSQSLSATQPAGGGSSNPLASLWTPGLPITPTSLNPQLGAAGLGGAGASGGVALSGNTLLLLGGLLLLMLMTMGHHGRR